MIELKTEQEKIGEYLGRVDSFLKYYETYPERIKPNSDYILMFGIEFVRNLDKINEIEIKEFEKRFLRLHINITNSKKIVSLD